jgi:hypothetical protein
VDPATVYRNVRRSLTDFDERVVARYLDAEAPVRTSFRQLLRSLDDIAGRLLGDDQLSRPEDQKGQTGHPLELAGPAAPELEAAAPEQAAPEQAAAEPTAAEPATPEPATPEPAAPEPATPEPTALEPAAPEPAAPEPTAPEPAAPEPAAPEPEAAEAVAEPSPEPATLDSAPALVQVTFALPGEVGADTVALCGEFDQWSADGIPLDRGSDGAWRTTVALEPGRSYRFRYLLDGERWENAWDADEYLPNGFGGTDSVIIVKPSSSQ